MFSYARASWSDGIWCSCVWREYLCVVACGNVKMCDSNMGRLSEFSTLYIVLPFFRHNTPKPANDLSNKWPFTPKCARSSDRVVLWIALCQYYGIHGVLSCAYKYVIFIPFLDRIHDLRLITAPATRREKKWTRKGWRHNIQTHHKHCHTHTPDHSKPNHFSNSFRFFSAELIVSFS